MLIVPLARALWTLLAEHRAATPAELAIVQASVDGVYEDFLRVVAEGRSLKRDGVHEIAQGRVWLGEDARGLRLVDKLGGLRDAIKAAKHASNKDCDAKTTSNDGKASHAAPSTYDDASGAKKDAGAGKATLVDILGVEGARARAGFPAAVDAAVGEVFRSRPRTNLPRPCRHPRTAWPCRSADCATGWRRR